VTEAAATVSCVILTMGDRPAEVNRAIDSVLAQRGTQVELVVVGNGADVPDAPAGVRTVRLPENVGVAAGRNAGVQACRGDVVLFLDDDG
jgi:glycosyltransferase involved in cell wall biosynthesis